MDFRSHPAMRRTMFRTMFDLFKRLVDRPADTPVAAQDARAAVAALLVEAAHADGSYEAAERDRILRVLRSRYAIGAADAEALCREGEAAHDAAVDLVRFTRAVKDAVPHEDRLGVLEAVWEVIYADGHRDHHESALVRKLCGLLHVEDREAGLVRQRVARRMAQRTAP